MTALRSRRSSSRRSCRSPRFTMTTTSRATSTWRTIHFGVRRNRQLTAPRVGRPAAPARTGGPRSGGGQLVALELVPQVLLRELAHARLGDLVDEGDVVGQPPL